MDSNSSNSFTLTTMRHIRMGKGQVEGHAIAYEALPECQGGRMICFADLPYNGVDEGSCRKQPGNSWYNPRMHPRPQECKAYA